MANKKLVLPPGISTDIKYKSLQERADYTPDRVDTNKSISMPMITPRENSRKTLNTKTGYEDVEPITKVNTGNYINPRTTEPISNTNSYAANYNPIKNNSGDNGNIFKTLTGGLAKGVLGTVKGFENMSDMVLDKAEEVIPALKGKRWYEATDVANTMQKGMDKVSEWTDYDKASPTRKYVEDLTASLPQMATMMIPGIGVGIFGASAAGNYGEEYAQKHPDASLNKKLAYSTIGGIGEVTLSKALGLIPGYEKVFGDAFKKGALNKLTGNLVKDSKFLGQAYARNATGEAIEEAVIDPVMGLAEKGLGDKDKKWFGKDGVVDPGQMAYDAMGGFLMAGALQSPAMVKQATNINSVKTYIENNYPSALAHAQALPDDTTSKKLANELIQKNTSVTLEDVTGLVSAVQKDYADLGLSQDTQEQPQTKIVANLPGLGQTEILQDNGNTAVIRTETGEVSEVRKIFIPQESVQEVPTQLAESQDQAAAEINIPKLSDEEKTNQTFTAMNNAKTEHESGKIESKDYLDKIAQENAKEDIENNEPSWVEEFKQQYNLNDISYDKLTPSEKRIYHELEDMENQLSNQTDDNGDWTQDTPIVSEQESEGMLKQSKQLASDFESGEINQGEYLRKLHEIYNPLMPETTNTSKTNVEPLQATESKPNVIASETKNKSIAEALLNEDGQTTLNKIKADMKTQGIDANFQVIKGGTKFHEDIRRITKGLGVQVVFYKGDKVPNGFISNSVKNTIFIHSSGEKNDMVATTGHEFLHHVKKTYAKEYGELLNFAKTYFTPEARQQFWDTYSNAPELQKQLSADENGLLEEMLADEMGNNFMDKNFWQKVYEHSKELFEKLVEVAQRIVKNFSNEDKYETYVGKETAETLSKKFEEAVASVRKQVAEGKVDTEAKIESGEGVQLSENKETNAKLTMKDAKKNDTQFAARKKEKQTYSPEQWQELYDKFKNAHNDRTKPLMQLNETLYKWSVGDLVKDGMIRVYRGAHSENSMKPGDYVTINWRYAKSYGGNLVKMDVPVESLIYVKGSVDGSMDASMPYTEFIYVGEPESKASEYFSATKKMLEDSKENTKSNGLKLSIRSKEFKQWFGDSKVVDENGEPLVVYHGTNAKKGNGFTKFEKGANWFTLNSEQATIFTQGSGRQQKGKYIGGNIMPVYVRIENPLDIRRIRLDSRHSAREILKYNGISEDKINKIIADSRTKSKLAKEEVSDETGVVKTHRMWADKDGGLDKDFGKIDVYRWFDNVAFTDALLENGIDGVIATEGKSTTLASFSATQIKSATGNNGEYASDNPDIRESVRQKERSHHQRYEEADITSLELLKKLTEESKKYEPISIKKTWEEAYDEVKGDIKGYRKLVDNMTEFRTAKDVAIAEAVLYITQNEAKELKNSGEKALANDMFELSARIGEKIDAHFTKAGQVVSMGRLWKALGTDATIKFIRKKVNNQRTDKENERLKAKVKELQAEIERLLENSKTEEEAKENIKEAIKKALDFKTGMFTEGELTEEQRGWIERLTEMALEGDLTGDELSQFFAARWKIPIFNGLMASKVMDLSEAINGLEKGSDEYNIAVNALNDYMNAIIKHDIWEHVNTVENLSMLSGTKSMSRNVIGNVGRLVAYDAEKFGTALLDIGRSMFTKDHNRKVMMPNLKAQAKGIVQGIAKDLKDFRYDTDSRAVEDGREFAKYIKYELPSKPSNIKDAVKMPLKITMNIFQRWVKLIMSDRPFSTAMINEVVSEAEKLAKKNGVKFDIVEAKQIAEQEAAETFFNGDDVIINRILQMRRLANFGESKAWGLGSVVLKFAKVPYNISKFAIEREWHLAAMKIAFRGISTGFAKARGKDGGYIKDEHFDSKEFMKDITKGLNGAFIMYLGTQLFAMGLISFRPNDDDKDKKLLGLEKLVGTNKYQLNLSAARRYLLEGFTKQEMQENDLLATLDWFTPLSILMIAGIKSQQVHEDRTKQVGNRDLEWYQKIWEEALAPTAGLTEGLIEQINTVLEMPMLQSLNKFKYADSPQEGLLEVLKDIPARFVPAPVKYAKEAVDNTQREIYSKIPLGDTINKVRVKLPGISKDVQPKIGMLGDELELYQNAKNNFLNIALNPAIVTRYKTTPETKKMLDVYQKYGIKDQIPSPVQKTFTAKKIDYPSLTKDETIILTAKEYTYYQQEFGKEAKKLLKGFTVYEKDKEYQQKEANKLSAQYTKAKQDIQAKIIRERGIK